MKRPVGHPFDAVAEDLARGASRQVLPPGPRFVDHGKGVGEMTDHGVDTVASDPPRRLRRRAAVCGLVGGLLAAAFGVCGPARASDPVFSDCPTTVLAMPGGSFDFSCGITNVGAIPGAVRILLTPGGNIQSLDADPSVLRLARGGTAYTRITGQLTQGALGGYFDVTLLYVPDDGGPPQTKSKRIFVGTLNK